MLRRRKEDVTKDIPPKEETIIDVELTMVQKKYYRAIYERNHSVLNKVIAQHADETVLCPEWKRFRILKLEVSRRNLGGARKVNHKGKKEIQSILRE